MIPIRYIKSSALKKHILKVKYYKQQINRHRVNQIREGEGERRSTCDRIGDLWVETIAREENGLDGSGDEGENRGYRSCKEKA
jgi:hypothetical protein